jgi:putative ABC transport system permease protein
MAQLVQNLRYASRAFFNRPLVSVPSVLSLALGIGVVTTLFGVVNEAFLRPLPVSAPSELVAAYTVDENNPGYLGMSHPNYEDFRQSGAFSGLALFQWIPLSLLAYGEPEQVFGQIVSGNYFDVLGVKMALGRAFLPEEDKVPGSHAVAVLSYGLWQRRFGSDPRIIGRTVLLNKQSFTIVGVAPPGFRGTDIGRDPQLWVPTMMYKSAFPYPYNSWFDSRRAVLFNAIGRLRPGTGLTQAEARVNAVARRLQRDFPEDNKGRGIRMIPLVQATISPGVRGDIATAVGYLMAAAGLVLLIACANVASLLLGQMVMRRKEISIRLCMGARRRQIIQQLLTESLLLALVAGGAGLLLARLTLALLAAMRPPTEVPLLLQARLDGPVLGFTLGVAVLTGLIFGLAPALQVSRPDFVSALKGGATSAKSILGLELRHLLIVVQTALCFFCLAGAGLFLHSLRLAQKVDPGFSPNRLTVMSFNAGAQGFGEAAVQDFYRRLLERVRQLPPVRSAALAQALPLSGGAVPRSVFVEGHREASDEGGVLVQTDAVSTDYFTTLGIGLAQGRGFVFQDGRNTQHVAIINETMAKRFWPGQDPVGKRFKFFGDDFFHSVAGVAKDSKYVALGEDPQLHLYYPLIQNYSPRVTLFARVKGDPDVALGLIRQEVRALDPTLPLTNVATMSDILDRSLWAPRASASLLGAFGILALALAILGVFSVTTYTVAQRTPEISLRIALGAQRPELLRMVLREGLSLVAIGIGVGLLASAAASRSLRSLLFATSGLDPATLGLTVVVLLAAAVVAIYLPARRAAATDPLEVLRSR